MQLSATSSLWRALWEGFIRDCVAAIFYILGGLNLREVECGLNRFVFNFQYDLFALAYVLFCDLRLFFFFGKGSLLKLIYTLSFFRSYV